MTNGRELQFATSAFQDPRISIELMRLSNRDKLNAYLQDTTRLLHNWLAAALTLVDVSRVISRRLYSSHQFKATYDARVRDTFANAPVVKFVHELRNYSLHHDVPIASATIEFKKEGNQVSSHIGIDAAELHRSGQFDGLSGEYLTKFKEKVPIATLVAEYEAVVAGFHKWAIDQHVVQFSAALSEAQEIIRELNAPFDAG